MKPVAVGHCARENEAEQPAAIFVGYSVISSIQRENQTCVRRSVRFQATDALLFSWWIPQGFVRRPQVQCKIRSLLQSVCENSDGLIK